MMRTPNRPPVERARRTTSWSRRSRGFTLPEASLAVMIVGIGFLATMELFSACTTENQRSAQITTAQMLCSNIQELMGGLAFKDPYYATTNFAPEPGESLATYNDVDDFDGLSFSPPIDSTRAVIPELAKYTQVITVMPVDPNRPGNNTDVTKPEIQKTIYTGAVRVRVSVLYRKNPTDPPVEVLRMAWVRLDN